VTVAAYLALVVSLAALLCGHHGIPLTPLKNALSGPCRPLRGGRAGIPARRHPRRPNGRTGARGYREAT